MIDFKFKEIDSSDVILQSREFTIESRVTGSVYLSCKGYLDKLCDSMGFKNLNVVKIIDQYAGKVISNISSTGDYKIYVNDDTSSFIVANPKSIKWYTDMLSKLKEEFELVSFIKYDNYLVWDQLIIKNKLGSKYVIYTDMKNEAVSVLSLHIDNEGILNGIDNEGTFKMTEGDDSFLNLFNVLNNMSLASIVAYPDEQMSVRESCEMLEKLGYLFFKRGKYYITGRALTEEFGPVEKLLELYNSSNWLIRCLTPFSSFKEAFKLVTLDLDKLSIWSIKDFYINNDKGQSDITCLKSVK